HDRMVALVEQMLALHRQLASARTAQDKIVVQRHIFMFTKLEPESLGKKDWVYQGFMTFAFWFITWTVLLTGSA
ncbi:MAG: hypothetical protein HGA55_08530, partial [Methanoregulaceae archaeon]|nr:hypothetical protein [Methanoregulaceae archaeon]